MPMHMFILNVNINTADSSSSSPPRLHPLGSENCLLSIPTLAKPPVRYISLRADDATNLLGNQKQEKHRNICQ